MKRVVHGILIPVGVALLLGGAWLFCYSYQHSVVTKDQFTAVEGATNCVLALGGMLAAIGGFCLAFNSIFELMEKR